MFEFHGWIAINEDESDEPDIAESDRRREVLCDEIESMIKILESENRSFHLHRELNGQSHLVFCGFHNHRDERIIDFFNEVGSRQPASYGKLHVRDDEDSRGSKGENAMMQWTMTRGIVAESTDALMTPCIPKIEPEFH